MSTPDIRVRLSPEGIKEVIFALRQVQKEGQAAGRNAAGGVGVVTSAIRDLKSLLPTIGLAAAVAGFLALGKQALATADQMGKIQQRVGGTVEEISGLNLAFRTNESDQAGMQSALQKTAQVLGQVQAGSKETRKALEAIGVDADLFGGLSTPRALEEIARNLVLIPPGGQRAAAAMKIFGKSAGDLIVALDAVGEQGIDAFIARARELGVLIDEDLARAAARANDSLGLIRIQAEGLATQFASGLAPAVADAMETFSEAVTGEGINGMRLFGQTVGFIVRLVTTLFLGLGKTIGAIVAKIGVGFDTLVESGKALVSGAGLAGVREALLEGARRDLAITQGLASDIAGLGKDLFAGPKASPAKGPGGGGREVDPGIAEDAQKAAEAQLAFRKQALANELALQQERLRSEEQINESAYEQGLISLDQYFGKRHELLVRAAEAEVAALKAQRAGLASQLGSGAPEDQTEADRIKIRTELAKINAEIAAREITSQRELAALANEELAAMEALRVERVGAAIELADMEGRRHDAFLANLEEEIRGIRELGVRAGQSAAEIEATVARFAAARSAQFNVEEATRRGTQALQSFQRDAEQIRRDMESGIISQIEGEQRLIDLTGDRIEQLKELAAQSTALANLTGDEAQIEKARQFADSIDQIAASYRAATDVGAQFKQGGIEAFQTGVQSLLENAENIKTLEDAFRSLGLAVAETMQGIAAEILSKQATLALLNAFGGGGETGAGGAGGEEAAAAAAAQAAQTAQLQVAATTLATAGGTITAGATATTAAATGLTSAGGIITSGAGALSAAAAALAAAAVQLQIANTIGAASGGVGAYKGGLIRGYARGGDVRGRKLNIPGPDKIPILAQEGEFMMRKARVQEPGALDFLRRWNAGQFSLAQIMRVPRFATGGEIGAAPGAAAGAGAGGNAGDRAVNLRLVTVLSPDLVVDALNSASGERTVLHVIERNSDTLKRLVSS
jgi:hypothetical protein